MPQLFKKHFFLIGTLLILILGFVLRTYNLSQNPPGFFCDEAAIGYNAYTLSTKGTDEYGVAFPFFFRSFGDYRLPIPIYANIPLSIIFGMSEITVRLTAVLTGIAGILFMILIGKELLDKPGGLLAGFFMSILPWHIQVSRWGSEYIYFPTFLEIGFLLYLKSYKRALFFPFALFFFALAMYTYYPTLFLTPIFTAVAVFLFVLRFKKKYWKQTLVGIFLFGYTCIPLFSAYKQGILLTRWNSINTTSMSLSERVKQTGTFYLQHFSLDFLFLKGDSGLLHHFVTRHSVRGTGELYWFQLPLLLLGIFFVIRKKREPGEILMLTLLFLYPLGSSVANDGPLATRSVLGVIPLSFLSAAGFDYLIELLKKIRYKFFVFGLYMLLTAFIVASVASYSINLYRNYPVYSADFWGWQYGARDIVHYFAQNEKGYDDEFMAPDFNAPNIFFKFYAPNNCSKCKIGLPGREYDPKKKQLFALSPEDLERIPQYAFTIRKTIYYPNHTVAFLIGEIVQ